MTYSDQVPIRYRRLLEILPGFFSWSLILFPFWGSLVIPQIVAYYIIAFDVYWLYRSLSLGILATLSYFRIQAAMKFDWLEDVKYYPKWNKVQHIVIIPNYNEPLFILRRTLNALKNQTLPTSQIHLVLAFEDREGESAREKASLLIQEFQLFFGSILTTFHPILTGEVIGKSSNMAYASRLAKKEIIDKRGFDIDSVTITSEDVDAQFDRQYFAALTYKFLSDPNRYYRFWQPAIMYYNNIWDIPALIRVFSTQASIVQIGMLNRKDRLINFSTYSTSLKLIDNIDYWDTNVIPEDYRIFFKAYFRTHGQVAVDPIFLPVHADAAHSKSFFKTMVNQYEQVKRWAWGASDDPWIIHQWLNTKTIPFWDKTIRVIKVLEDHFLWPVNWFAITIGATLPPLLNPNFARTVLGKSLPQTSSAILTISLISLLVTILIDFKQRPGRDKLAWYKKIMMPFEFILLPVVGLFFSALPGLDAHTRLMLGKYIEYRTTDKV